MTVTDEELIERLNEASKLENERFEKRKRVSAAKIPKVQELQTEFQTAPTPVQSHPKPRESPTTVAVTAVKNKETRSDTQQIIEELRKEMKEMFLAAMESSPHTMAPKQREKGCRKCRGEGKGENCMHCFKCGREGHYSRGCRAPRLSTGNGEGLLRWDQQ